MRSVFLMLAACESSRAPAPTPPVAIADAAVVDAAPIDPPAVSPPRPTIPPTLASAPAWVMRRLDVGMVPFPQRAETFTLRRDNGRAVLEIAAQKAISKDLMNVSGWEPPASTVYLGTATELRGSVTLEVTHGADTLRFVCKMAKEKVAPANAVRKPGPRRGEACGDKGHWVPVTTTSVDVLRCEIGAEYARKHGGIPYLALAPAPGIEWAYVNDDCAMQGGGWRAMPADQSIAPFRGD